MRREKGSEEREKGIDEREKEYIVYTVYSREQTNIKPSYDTHSANQTTA